jgi:glycosyltransferase involved in cell wall biosynthesis
LGNLSESLWASTEKPQDFKAYSDADHVSIVPLPENNRGIAYARQIILEYAIGHDDGWFWMLDDNIYSFAVKVKQGEIIKDDASLLESVEYGEFEVHD